MLHSWTTDGLSHSEKHPVISDAINAAICHCQVIADIPSEHFDAQLEQAIFGETSMIRYSSRGAQKAVRNYKHLDSVESDSVLLYLPITARFTIFQGNNTTQVDPGSLAIVPLSKPLIGVFCSTEDKVQSAVQIRLPLSPLRELQPQISQLFNHRISLNTGSGRVFQSLVTSLLDEAAYIDAECNKGMEQLITDSISALCYSEMGRQSSSTIDRHHPSHTHILKFIKAHLSHPELSLDMIAEQFSSSRRFVHRAFEHSGWTVWSYIREQRLLSCQRELRNPELAHLSISQICYSWGFKDIAHFSRSYKARFGHSPTQERSGQ